RIFRLVCVTAGVLVLAILALILISTAYEGWPALRESGWSLITSKIWITNDPDGDGPLHPQFGALAYVYGSAVVSLIALLIAVPISIGIALLLTELAHRRLRGPVITIIDLLAAVPSVVFGLWGILVVAPAIK